MCVLVYVYLCDQSAPELVLQSKNLLTFYVGFSGTVEYCSNTEETAIVSSLIFGMCGFYFLECLRQAMKIRTVIDEVFGGQNINTVMCRECPKVSVMQ